MAGGDSAAPIDPNLQYTYVCFGKIKNVWSKRKKIFEDEKILYKLRGYSQDKS